MATEASAAVSEQVGWQDAFRLRDNLLQPDVYAFEKALQKLGGFQLSIVGGGTVQATHAICAAIEAGWIAEPESGTAKFTPSPNGSAKPKEDTNYYIGSKGIHEMTAGEVIWYGARVTEAYRDATAIPPN